MTNNREEQIYKAADKATYQTPPQYSELVHKSRKVMCAYETGFIDGCVWADQHPNWISVEDELPPHDTEYEGRMSVDCYITDGVDVEISYYNYYNNTWDDVRLSGEVTHWYIPQPPRKEE